MEVQQTPNSSAAGIDLHAHTTASDGSLSPTELVQKAAGIGLLALAVTDHDTIGGLDEAGSEAARIGLDFVPGVELSVEDSGGRFHLLGYLFRPDDPTLTETLIRIRTRRAERNEQIARLMQEMGLPVTMDDVRAEAGDGDVIARPHFAQAFVKKGVVSTYQEAFDRYLATGKPLYQPKEVLTPADAIALIHNAGGLAVMAHPALVPLSAENLATRVADLAENAGMDGLECYYSQHSPADTERFLALAARLNLLITGGSDFHGTPKPHVVLGKVVANGPAPAELLEKMRAQLA
jgi:predicted metal-dependent phosphoesterase TrpH